MKQISKLTLPVLFAAFIVLCGMTTATHAQDNDSYPKPDFKELEKWYEVVKFEYNVFSEKVYLTVKAKEESHKRPNKWDIEWLDADGVRVAKYPITFVLAEVGKPHRADTYAPSEYALEKLVKSVTLIRIKN